MTESLTIQMTQRQPARSDHRSKYKIRKIGQSRFSNEKENSYFSEWKIDGANNRQRHLNKMKNQKRKLRRIYKGGCEKSTIKKKESIRKRREI